MTDLKMRINEPDEGAAYNQGWKDGFDEGYASADDWLAQHEDAMREHGWIRERTCHEVDNTPPSGSMVGVTYSTVCSECGQQLALDEYDAPKYCPGCGAKVVE